MTQSWQISLYNPRSQSTSLEIARKRNFSRRKIDGRTHKRARPPETAAPRPNRTHMHHYQAKRKNDKIVWHGYAAVWISLENETTGQKEVSLTGLAEPTSQEESAQNEPGGYKENCDNSKLSLWRTGRVTKTVRCDMCELRTIILMT